MIDIGNIRTTIFQRLKKIAPGHILLILSFKRDRLLAIARQDNKDIFYLYRIGFSRSRSAALGPDALKKALKQGCKSEFPRSNKLHLTTISQDEFHKRYPDLECHWL